MLREWEATEKPEEGELKKRLIAARDKLARQQMLIKEKKVPAVSYTHLDVYKRQVYIIS